MSKRNLQDFSRAAGRPPIWSSEGRLGRQDAMPMPTPGNTVVQGNRMLLPRVNAAGVLSFNLQQLVGLVRAEKLQWGPWSVNLDAQLQITPGQTQGVTGRPRVILSWGVAGLRRQMEFDYPWNGGSFVVNCDAVEVQVRATVAEPSAAVTDREVWVGAWLTPGSSPGEPCPMILQNADSAATADIPPFARYLVMSPYNGAGVLAAGETRIRFTDPSTLVTYARYVKAHDPVAGSDSIFRVPVPPLATRVEMTDTSAPNFSSMWELAFA